MKNCITLPNGTIVFLQSVSAISRITTKTKRVYNKFLSKDSSGTKDKSYEIEEYESFYIWIGARKIEITKDYSPAPLVVYRKRIISDITTL